jgi:hypothetical protein
VVEPRAAPALEGPGGSGPPPAAVFSSVLVVDPRGVSFAVEARGSRCTAPIGNGFRRNAASACAVTHTGVWELPDEYEMVPSRRCSRTR